eukprot:4361915-Prymnesium_polylepis.1
MPHLHLRVRRRRQPAVGARKFNRAPPAGPAVERYEWRREDVGARAPQQRHLVAAVAEAVLEAHDVAGPSGGSQRAYQA